VPIALVHDAGPGRARRAVLRDRFPGARAVCFGHSHLPVCDDRDGLLLLNPGSPTERRRAPWRSYGELVIEDGALAARIIRL
jgi:predicted phosphodiesterase